MGLGSWSIYFILSNTKFFARRKQYHVWIGMKIYHYYCGFKFECRIYLVLWYFSWISTVVACGLGFRCYILHTQIWGHSQYIIYKLVLQVESNQSKMCLTHRLGLGFFQTGSRVVESYECRCGMHAILCYPWMKPFWETWHVFWLSCSRTWQDRLVSQNHHEKSKPSLKTWNWQESYPLTLYRAMHLLINIPIVIWGGSSIEKKNHMVI